MTEQAGVSCAKVKPVEVWQYLFLFLTSPPMIPFKKLCYARSDYTSTNLFVGKTVNILQLSDELVRVSIDNGVQCTRISVEVT